MLTGEPSADLMITAVEALAAPEGNYKAFANRSGRVTNNRREFMAIAGAASVAGYAGYHGGKMRPEAKPNFRWRGRPQRSRW